MAYGGLDHDQTFVLIREVDEAVSLSRSGQKILIDLRHAYDDHAAVLTLLAIASEKMLKLSLGLMDLDQGHGWPSVKAMKKHGHDVVTLNEKVVMAYADRMQRSTAPGYIAELVAGRTADETLHRLLQAVSRWGLAGRFYGLDSLAGTPQQEPAANELWEEIENPIVTGDAQLLDDIADPVRYEAARHRVNQVIAESFGRWWEMHARAWMTGVISEEVKGLGHALRLGTPS